MENSALACAEAEPSSSVPAVGLEAGAGWPPSQNLETSFCVPGVAMAGLRLDCVLQGVCLLRTCWSINTDELPKRKPYITHGGGSVGRDSRFLMQSTAGRGWRADLSAAAHFSPLCPTLLWMNPAPLLLVAWQVPAVHTIKRP